MKTDALTHKKILIVGAGVTGVSVAKFLSARGINFDVADERAVLPDEMLRVVPDLQHFTVLDSELTANYDVLVLSPGVPRAHPAIAAAISLEKPVVGDIELFAGVVEQPVIAVTGSNGKSTVVSMLAHVLKT
nr:UDP-N-acetylmuramoyl-L-alanine--D-glutamate ligase [Gammaproteobacteria bacterium]